MVLFGSILKQCEVKKKGLSLLFSVSEQISNIYNDSYANDSKHGVLIFTYHLSDTISIGTQIVSRCRKYSAPKR